MQSAIVQGIDSPDMRRAGRELLSVALMDARNHSLHVMGLLGATLEAGGFVVPPWPELNPPLWELGHIGWFQEWWIARNLQRQRGRQGDGQAARLVSAEPAADRYWSDSQVPHAARWQIALPGLTQTRDYLLATLETTLELLEKADDDDAALHFYRLALFYEDQRGEALITMAQTLGLAMPLAVPGPMASLQPVSMGSARWRLGVDGSDGFAFDNEYGACDVVVPEFEIDAQPVVWSQFVEFVDDGGYDRPELWHPQGWTWLEQQSAGSGGRAPRYVDQIGVASGAVMQTRFGTPRRMLGGQPVMHVTWWEADAWCRWAGRRLPAEVEWEMAAHMGARRGFRWGAVWEWTGSSARVYPGFAPGPSAMVDAPQPGGQRVMRGASFATRERMKHPNFRSFQLPGADHLFVGFRSCAA